MKVHCLWALMLMGCAGASSNVASQPAGTALVAGDGSADPVVMPKTSNTPASQISGLEFKASDNMTQGCLFVSRDQKQLACVDHVVEMGAVTSQWHLLDIANNAVAASYTVYDGMMDDKGVKVEALTRMNEALKLGGFAPIEAKQFAFVGDDKQPVSGSDKNGSINWGGKSYSVVLPPLSDKPDSPGGKQVMACCHWAGEAISEANGHLGVLLRISCKYSGALDMKSDACYIQDYNDESMPHDSRVIALKLQ